MWFLHRQYVLNIRFFLTFHFYLDMLKILYYRLLAAIHISTLQYRDAVFVLRRRTLDISSLRRLHIDFFMSSKSMAAVNPNISQRELWYIANCLLVIQAWQMAEGREVGQAAVRGIATCQHRLSYRMAVFIYWYISISIFLWRYMCMYLWLYICIPLSIYITAYYYTDIFMVLYKGIFLYVCRYGFIYLCLYYIFVSYVQPHFFLERHYRRLSPFLCAKVWQP